MMEDVVKELEDIESERPDFKLTDKQVEALSLIKTQAVYIMLYGGSRSAKTFLLVRLIVWRAIAVNKSRHAILRFRFNHVKASILYDTFPKVMDLCFPDCPTHIDKQDWFVKFPNGSEIWFGGLDDKERTEKILGNEYATIFLNEVSQISYNSYLTVLTRLAQVCYYKRGGKTHQLRLKMLLDENPPSKSHWTGRLFIDGLEPISKKPVKNPHEYASLLMNPDDNRENLSKVYLNILDNLPKRKRDRFKDGKFSDDSENALWTSEIIEKNRVDGEGLPDMIRIVVAVDPSGAGDDEDNKDNDAIGIVVAGLGIDGIGYLLEDLTCKAGPATWGKVACDAVTRWDADRVIGEENFGGKMVKFVIRTANPSISYKSVHASRGKVIRAEPVSALHETGKIKYVGNFPDLEDECCSMTTGGYIGEGSPNRLDAKVWAFTELFPGLTKPKEKKDNNPVYIPKLKRF